MMDLPELRPGEVAIVLTTYTSVTLLFFCFLTIFLSSEESSSFSQIIFLLPSFCTRARMESFAASS